MKAIKSSVLAVILLLGSAVAADAFAHGGYRGGYRGGYGGGHHSGVSIGIGVGVPGYWYGGPYYRPYYRPYYYPYAYSYPYPYYPPAVAVSGGPAVYVEQGQPAVGPAAPAAPAAAHWYYCNESQAYYPYVRECAGPWQRVAPQPPPS